MQNTSQLFLLDIEVTVKFTVPLERICACSCVKHCIFTDRVYHRMAVDRPHWTKTATAAIFNNFLMIWGKVALPESPGYCAQIDSKINTRNTVLPVVEYFENLIPKLLSGCRI